MANVYGIELSALGFYGLPLDEFQKKSLFERFMFWFSSHNTAPNTEGAGGKGFTSRMKDSPAIQKKLLKVGFAEAQSFEFYFVPPTSGGRKYPWLLTAWTERMHGVVRVLSKNEVDRVPSSSYFATAREIAEIVRPKYGIGFRRDICQNPSGYISGFVDGLFMENPEEEDEELSIARWGDIGMSEKVVYLKGELRDVYPWNFLTAPQLTAPVGRLTLESWIRANPGFGKLIPVTDEMLLWETNEDRIPEARKALWDAGRIFDYRKYLGPPGPPRTAEETLKQVLDAFGGDPEDFQIFDGKGNEIPADEVHKRIGKPKGKGGKQS